MSRPQEDDPFEYDVFLSHSSLDKEVVREVAEYFRKRGIKVWFDEWVIGIGELIPSKIDEGLAKSRHIVLCMSPNFFNKSDWGERERAAATMQDPANRKGRVLPLLIEKCEQPPTLQALLFANYSDRKKNELGRLCDRILSTRPARRDEASELPLTPPGFIRHFLDRYCPGFHNWLTRVKAFGFDFPPEHGTLEAYNEDVYKVTSAKLYEQTLVKLRAKSLDSGPDVSGARKGAFHSTIQQVVREIEGREENQDAASATISALSRKSRPVRNLVSRILGDKEPLVLLGEPGSGKSLSIHQARLLVARQNLKRVFPDFCVYIPLGEFHLESGEVTDAALAEFVKQQVDKRIRPYLWALRRNHRLVVFLDGMDEMSRRRYNDHVEAISDFARAGEGKAKTVVACRTADFSPKFQHRRLVLLPFGRQQILSYLRLQFQGKPVQIGDKLWSLKDLARELLHSNLPIDATSPYVLWMFCRYIHDEGKWPESRVQLLRHYYDVRLREYLEKAHLDSGKEAISKAFATWGRIAFRLAVAHRGVAISVKELHSAIGTQEVDEGIKLGRAIGLLEMSLAPQEDANEALVKFEHHRAEEFFTAYYIDATGESVEWEELFDYPRWRETLLNVLLLGKSAAARQAVEHALDAAAALPEETEDWRHERKLVERVEFAAKAHADAQQSTAFAERLAAAVYNLARCGNPITRIKMLEIARRTPDVDVYQVAEPSLNSKVQFLRTQALLVASASDNESSERFLHHHFLFAFAKGEFLRRLREFFSVAIRLKRPTPLLMVLIGCLFFAISPVLQLAVVWVATAQPERVSTWMSQNSGEEVRTKEAKKPPEWLNGFPEWRFGIVERITGHVSYLRRADQASRDRAAAKREATLAEARSDGQALWTVSRFLASPLTKWSVLFIALVCWAVTALKFLKYLHFSALVGGIMSLALVAVCTLTWMNKEALGFVVVFIFISSLVGTWMVLYLPMRALFVGCLVMFGLSVSWLTDNKCRMRPYIDACWRPRSDHELYFAIGFWRFVPLAVPLFPVLILAYLIVIDLIGSLLPNVAVQWLLAAEWRSVLFYLVPCVVILIPLLVWLWLDIRRERSVLSKLVICGSVLVGLAIAIVATDAVVSLFHSYASLRDLATSAGAWTFRMIVALVVFAPTGLILVVVWKFFRAIQKNIGARVLPARDTRSWLQRFSAADPSHQGFLLRRVSAEQLGLNPEEFLAFLADTCKPRLRDGDPPDSEFWRKWQEASDIARLERDRR